MWVLPDQAAPVNEPTWTGRSGGSGAPGARFGATANLRLAQAASLGSGAASPSQQALPAPQAAGVPSAAGTSVAAFGGGLAGTTGGVAPRSSVLLARLRERQAAVNAAASSAARNDPEASRFVAQPLILGILQPSSSLSACKPATYGC